MSFFAYVAAFVTIVLIILGLLDYDLYTLPLMVGLVCMLVIFTGTFFACKEEERANAWRRERYIRMRRRRGI